MKALLAFVFALCLVGTPAAMGGDTDCSANKDDIGLLSDTNTPVGSGTAGTTKDAEK